MLLIAGTLCLGACLPFKQRFSTPHTVDFKSANDFAELAEAAYEGTPVIEVTCRRQGYAQVTVQVLPQMDTLYFLATDTVTHRHLISVRGTANLKNALLDAEYEKITDPLLGIGLHRGFQTIARRIFDDAVPRMDKNYAVSLTGHSLGGAEAVALAMYFKMQGWKVAQVVTFGQPKVTDAQGVKQFRGLPLLRFVNSDDPVASVPPREYKYFTKPYEHLGAKVILREGPNYSYLEEGNDDDALGLAFWKSLRSKDQIQSDIPRHYMANYRKALQPKISAAIEVPYKND